MIALIPDPEVGGYFVRVPDLPGCISQGETVDEAHTMIRDAMRGWLTVGLEHGDPIPEPRPLTGEGYSGQFRVRLPRRIHRALAEAAQEEGISPNLFVATMLAAAVGAHQGRAAPSAPANGAPVVGSAGVVG